MKLTVYSLFINFIVLNNIGFSQLTFAPAALYNCYGATYRVACDDFDSDGKNDVVTLDFASPTGISFLKGDGVGGLASAITTTMQYLSISDMVNGDFNMDGKQDLAVATHFTYEMFLGNGLGNFTKGSFTIPQNIDRIVTSDFNNDGFKDMVLLEYYSSNTSYVSIVLSTPTSNFSVTCTFSLASLNVDCKDIDKDGKQDLICASANGITIYYGDGTGLIGAHTTNSPLTYTPSSLVCDDVNNDGKMDIILTKQQSIKVYLGNGIGGFIFYGDVVNSGTFYNLSLCDLNRDGNLDLYCVNSSNYPFVISYYVGNGFGMFNYSGDVSPGLDALFQVICTDLNNDSKKDFISINKSNTITNPGLSVNLNTSIVGINENFKPVNEYLKIYPNPSQTIINIASTQNINLDLINSLGIKIKSIILNTENNYCSTLDNLNAGLYFVIGSHDGNSINQKIVIENH